jgi:hypothetical protein
MAKNSLPSVDSGTAAVQSVKAEVVAVSPQHAEIVEGYPGRKIDVKMNHTQAVKFKEIMRKLEDKGAMLNDGSYVTKRRHVVLWMIEQMEL